MSELTPEEQAALRWLQLPAPNQERRRPRFDQYPRGSSRRSPPPPQPRGELAAVLLTRNASLGALGAERQAVCWAKMMFARKRVEEWIDAGLGTHEWGLAWEFEANGITPQLAVLVVRKETMIDRAWAGMAPVRIADMLRREGLLRSQSA